ncbi:MAG: hypothetical protein LCH84_18285 [Gemmatimonadetes bacterium]|nr:hypothetical protein [Gemmatimonadota bacterium]
MTRARRTLRGALVCLLLGALPLGRAHAVAQEHEPSAVVLSAASDEQPADSLFREGTRLLTRGQYDRAAALFEQLRLQHARSPYVPDSYYWQAFALQRLENAAAMRRALLILEEQQLRFPEAASTEDVLALRERIEGVLGRDRVAVAAGSCRERDDDDALTELMLARDREWVRGFLASILARRDACTRELRRAAVYLLGRQRDEPSRAVLQQVAMRDPDEQVRAEARRLAMARPSPAADSARTATPTRVPGDTMPHATGDFELLPLRFVRFDRVSERLSLQLPQPMQVIVLSLVPGRAVELIDPASRGDSKLRAAGTVNIDLRGTVVAEAAGPSSLDRFAVEARRDAALEACYAREIERLRKEIDRQWANRADKSGKPSVQQISGDRTDVTIPDGRAPTSPAAAQCKASVAAQLPTTQPARVRQSTRQAGTREVGDRVLLVLASPRPVSFTLLLARLGAMPVGGATRRAMVDAVTTDLFEGHAAPWSGAYIAW